jgi:hypothetical protein
MKKHLNDPKINKKYNYIYKIENVINHKIYIGVHRTDNINDGYMGSGLNLKRSIKKYGIENFKKIILEYFETYQEALDAERKMVTLDFIERNDTYNIIEGGYGACMWSSEAIKKLKLNFKKQWESEEYRRMMREKVYDNPEINKRKGAGIKKWIEENSEKHKEKMLKINKNPEKIKKMAEKHKGMKRSEEAKRNIRNGILKSREINKESAYKLSGKGSIYIYNENNNICKRHNPDVPIPDGWKKGTNKKPIEKYIFICDQATNKIKRHPVSDEIPIGWIKNGGKKHRKKQNG